MSNESLERSMLDESVVDDHTTEMGFLVLAMAQLVSIFGFWFGYWPTAFGLERALGLGFSGFFLASGLVGFYLSFRYLSSR